MLTLNPVQQFFLFIVGLFLIIVASFRIGQHYGAEPVRSGARITTASIAHVADEPSFQPGDFVQVADAPAHCNEGVVLQGRAISGLVLVRLSIESDRFGSPFYEVNFFPRELTLLEHAKH